MQRAVLEFGGPMQEIELATSMWLFLSKGSYFILRILYSKHIAEVSVQYRSVTANNVLVESILFLIGSTVDLLLLY